MNSPIVEEGGVVNSNPMNPANTPKGGIPIAARPNRDNRTAYFGMAAARPLMAWGSTSSPYLVRITCQATSSPPVARPTAPASTVARAVAVEAPATNHQRIEKNETLP